MRALPPAAMQLARRIVAHEIEGLDRRAPESVAGVADAIASRICESLRPMLGGAGVQALLARALRVAARERPLLEGARAGPDGRVCGLQEALRAAPAEEAEQTALAVLGGFIGLLMIFIGEDLTVRFVAEAWPGLGLEKVGGEEEDSQ